MKIMGKRQIGQLQPFELVVVLILSEIASSAMQSAAAPILNSLIPIATIAIIQVIMAIINLKSERLRNLICGKPSIIISKGRIVQSEMTKLRMNINDLQEELRANGYFDIADVQYAIMETNGHLSIMPKTDKRPLQPGDLSLNLQQEEPSTAVILDGHINHQALRSINKNKAWLQEQMRKNHIINASDIFIAHADSEGNFSFQLKEAKKGHKNA